MLEAKKQLSKLVKACRAGEDANHGAPAVRPIILNTPIPARSLAAELAELQQVLAEESADLTLPNRVERNNPFTAVLADEHAAD